MSLPGTHELLALAIVVSFAAGLNLSAVILTLGLLSKAGALVLPGPIEMLGDWWVIGISGTLFVIELLADKIPAFDLIWNALLTFIRVPAGALLAFAYADTLSPGMQLLAAILGGGVTFAAHGAKLTLRSAVSTSPEPFSNVGLSVADDVAAIGLTWFAAEYPLLAATIAVILLVGIFFLIRWVLATVRAVFRGAARQISDGTHAQPPT